MYLPPSHSRWVRVLPWGAIGGSLVLHDIFYLLHPLSNKRVRLERPITCLEGPNLAARSCRE